MAKLIVAGNACVDIYVPPHEPPPPGGIRRIASLDVEIGGNGANTAITASRLGVSTAFAGVLGNDLFGRHIRDSLAREGVDISRLKLLEGRTSPATLVHNDAKGERSFVHHPGTNEDYTLSDVALRAPCEVFHFAAPELLGGIWPGGAIEAARRLKSLRRTVSLDTFVDLESSSADRIVREHRALLGLVDLAFPNEEEARAISGKRELSTVIRYFHECGVKIVAIKRGERGAVVSWQGRIEEVPAVEVRAVDTCGAGDNFAAGFLAGHIRGLDPLTSTRIGCTLGTLCVLYRGALTGTADRARLEKVLGRFELIR